MPCEDEDFFLSKVQWEKQPSCVFSATMLNIYHERPEVALMGEWDICYIDIVRMKANPVNIHFWEFVRFLLHTAVFLCM